MFVVCLGSDRGSVVVYFEFVKRGSFAGHRAVLSETGTDLVRFYPQLQWTVVRRSESGAGRC